LGGGNKKEKNALGIKSQSATASKSEGNGLFGKVGLGGIKKSFSLGNRS
jgi:hypothetical protein